MNQETRHSFLIKGSPEAIVNALVQKEYIRKWWREEARVGKGKRIFGWSGYGWMRAFRSKFSSTG